MKAYKKGKGRKWRIKHTIAHGCGAALDVEMNRAYIFCKYCGTKTVIQNEIMKTNINVGNDINISAKTDMDTLIKTAKYAVSLGQYDKANELIMASILSGSNNYEIYITKAMIDLQKDDGKSLFESIRKLRELEKVQKNNEVTEAINELMHYTSKKAGVTVLHNATFHEQFDMVKFCVEHGSDVNLVVGMNRVSPISIMFVPVSNKLHKIDGTPFVRNKKMVKQIRDYLVANGAYDKFRFGY